MLAECGAAIDRARQELGATAGSVRWVRLEGIHLTLKFLGSLPPSTETAIIDRLSMELLGIPAFELAIGGTGVFPNSSRPRVLWFSLLGEVDALRVAQERVEAAAVPLGYPRETRPFQPHLTLGRVRETASATELAAIGRLTDTWTTETSLRFRVSSVSLMRSQLAPDGARYTRLARIEFDTK